jgi:hypothetical protein
VDLGAKQKGEPEAYMPPVFFWINNKSGATPFKSFDDAAEHVHSDSTSIHESKDIPMPGGPEGIRKAQISDEEILTAILDDIDNQLSKAHDYNMDLLGGGKYPGGKLYKAIIPATKAEVQSILEHLDTEPECFPRTSEHRGKVPWQQQLSYACDLLGTLFNFFLPASYSCKINGKYWGAVVAMVKASET